MIAKPGNNQKRVHTTVLRRGFNHCSQKPGQKAKSSRLSKMPMGWEPSESWEEPYSREQALNQRRKYFWDPDTWHC